MKKSQSKIVVVFALGIFITYGIITGYSASPKQLPAEEFAILTFYPYSATPYRIDKEQCTARIYYSSRNEMVKFSKQELDTKASMSLAASILERLSNEGFTLVSTSVTSIPGETICYLRKVK